MRGKQPRVPARDKGPSTGAFYFTLGGVTVNWLSVVSFIWKFVVPNLKKILKIVGADTYHFICSEVEKADASQMDGLAKRTHVYAEAVKYLKEKEVDIEMIGSVAVYIMIEIAVLNLKYNDK